MGSTRNPPDWLTAPDGQRGFRVTFYANRDFAGDPVHTAGTRRSLLSWYGDTADHINADSRWQAIRLGCMIPLPADPIGEAVALAARSDVAVIFAGLSNEWESEGVDRESMDLYNVKRGTWHTHTLDRDATVLIVENRDTVSANSKE